MNPQLEEWQSRGRSFDYLGFEVFYRHEGEGPVLLLVHGYPFSSFDWKEIWPTLTARFTVIAPDMLGMGFSAKPSQYEYTVHDHADMHEALLAHLGVSECHVLAHDIGDSVVQEMLARHEERGEGGRPYDIRSITWLNGGMFIEAYRPRLMQTLTAKTPVGGVFAMLPAVFLSDRVLRPAINEVFGPDTKPSDELWRQLSEILSYNEGRRVMHKVGRFVIDRARHRNRWVAAMRATSIAMRLIDGPCDPNSGRHMAERYAELIPDADVVYLAEEIGHWPQIEDPQGVLTHFLEFVDGLQEGSPTATIP
jgi:pimeloyl-ACP methyl ester carboxylesterase